MYLTPGSPIPPQTSCEGCSSGGLLRELRRQYTGAHLPISITQRSSVRSKGHALVDSPVEGEKERWLYTIKGTIKCCLFIPFPTCQVVDAPHPSGRPCRLPPKATKVNCLSRSSHPVLYVPSHLTKVSCTISAPLQGDCCFIWAMTT